MKNLVLGLLLAVGTLFTASAQKKQVKTVALEQTKGEFTQKAITLSEGTYVFEINNKGVGKDVGFVLTPKGHTDKKHHIKNAYVTKVVANNAKGHSKEVKLEKGEYVYFCPLNPTPQYTLTVK